MFTRTLFTLILTLFTFSVAAQQAAERNVTTPTGGEAEYCDASECGSLPTDGTDPTGGGEGGGSDPVCPPNNGYENCMDRCDCQYQKNLKVCGKQVACRDAARMELAACQGNCIADWTP